MDGRIILVFDFFGVISSEVFNLWLARHHLEDQYELAISITRRADLGEINLEEEATLLGQISGQGTEEILAEWYELMTINQPIIDFMKANNRKYRFALLSNASAEFVRPILGQYELDEIFEQIFISSEMQLRKPHQDIFWTVAQSLNVTPERCIMIDDKQPNIDAATSIGMRGILYKIP